MMKTGTKLAIVGLVLALGCMALWSYHIRQVDIPENRALFVGLFLIAAALGVAAFVKGTSWRGGLAAAPAIFIGLFVPFTVVISSQAVTATAVAVGDTLPSFSAPDENGELFDSASLHGHIVLIKFFRAHW